MGFSTRMVIHDDWMMWGYPHDLGNLHIIHISSVFIIMMGQNFSPKTRDLRFWVYGNLHICRSQGLPLGISAWCGQNKDQLPSATRHRRRRRRHCWRRGWAAWQGRPWLDSFLWVFVWENPYVHQILSNPTKIHRFYLFGKFFQPNLIQLFGIFEAKFISFSRAWKDVWNWDRHSNGSKGINDSGWIKRTSWVLSVRTPWEDDHFGARLRSLWR